MDSLTSAFGEALGDWRSLGHTKSSLKKELHEAIRMIKQTKEGTKEVLGLVEVHVCDTDAVWKLLKHGSRARSTNANQLSSPSHWNSRMTQMLPSSLAEFLESNLSSSETYCNFSGGDCKTLMIVQINTSATDLRETLSCLKFANRVRGIERGPARKRTDILELFKYKQQVVPGMLIAETTNKVVAANCYYLDDKTINIDKAKTITDYSGHGTSCASVIAGRIVDSVGYGLIKKEVAVAEAVTHGAHILSMSISEQEKKKVLGKRAVSSSAARSGRMGPSFMSSNIAQSTLLAVLQNVLACVASGNEGVRNFATWQLTLVPVFRRGFSGPKYYWGLATAISSAYPLSTAFLIYITVTAMKTRKKSDINICGSGLICIKKAVDPGLVYDIDGLDYVFRRRLKDMGLEEKMRDKVYKAYVAKCPKGVEITVKPRELKFVKGQERNFEMHVAVVDWSRAEDNLFSAVLEWKSKQYTVRSPIIIEIERREWMFGYLYSSTDLILLVDNAILDLNHLYAGNVKQAGKTKMDTTRDDKRDPLPGASRGQDKVDYVENADYHYEILY
ncbi:hypothetical protein RHSIM_Rhsim13G0227800 [Rhododendron simsii]|uniref:Kinesin motor domain-containing protein n=1 Tax=Rhododendron simsii TaxID=118357 RepID=A0A834G5D1_RHOSS|nr:hypothetical protein RHSIM_Rhsim13G0227800 [Rhododendron simsii]